MYQSWEAWMKDESLKSYYVVLMQHVKEAYRLKKIFPKESDIFTSFLLTPLDKVKVVILGQDPYHDENQAHGLAFSVLCEKLPPSLKNIYQELHDDLGFDIPKTGNLEPWAKAGVLLLNTVLTVEAHKANSHQNLGWQTFTRHALQIVSEQDRPIVVILWGNQAKKYAEIFKNPKHLVIKSAHPSPLSAYQGFLGSKPFSKANHYLEKMGVKPVDWNL